MRKNDVHWRNGFKAWPDGLVVEDLMYYVKGKELKPCSDHSFSRTFVSQLFYKMLGERKG